MARFAHFMASCEVPPPWEWVQALMEQTLAVAPEEYDPPDLLPLVLRCVRGPGRDGVEQGTRYCTRSHRSSARLPRRSLVRLGWAPEPAWLTEVLRRVGMRAGDLDPSSLIITANALATLQVRASPSPPTSEAQLTTAHRPRAFGFRGQLGA